MAQTNPKSRKIVHIDMDAFFASVEQRERKELRGRPVVVGGEPRARGVVAAASYEARKFGIRSAMSSAKAYQLCPQAIFVPPNFTLYRQVSDQIHGIFQEVTPWVEPLSLDEAYLDVTENLLGEPLARDIAVYIKKRIKAETGLTASAGVGPNKFIAKIASDLRKPDGLVVIPPEKVDEFLRKLPVEKMWGVGPATAEKLHQLGLRTAGDIREASVTELERVFGKYGPFLHGLSRGVDDRPVEPDSEPKSRGTETTFERDIVDIQFLLNILDEQARDLAEDLKKIDRPGRTVTLKLKYADFKTITRSRTLPQPVDSAKPIYETAADLLQNATEAGREPVRLIGVSMSGLVRPDEPIQLWLDLPLP